MNEKKIITKAAVELFTSEETLSADSALNDVRANIDRHKGAIFSSGFDYPGRHSRWDIGFVNPAIEFYSIKREFYLHALNDQGKLLLPLFEQNLKNHRDIEKLQSNEALLQGVVSTSTQFFTEEERSRKASVFSVLRSLHELFAPANDEDGNGAYGHFGFYGAFGYDLLMQFEEVTPKLSRATAGYDCHLFLPLEIIVVDRKKETASRCRYSVNVDGKRTSSLQAGGVGFALAEGSGTKEIESDHKPGEFADKVAKVIEGTKRGDYFEVVLSQTFSTHVNELPTALFDRLCRINPSPYLFLINLGREQLVGSSPEIFLRVTGRRVETCPIAGTIARGATALEDAERATELLSSEKEASELTMCTDVDRNDLARVCKPGSVRVIGRRQLEFYSHLIHTVDHIEGILDERFDSLDAFQTHMWACTVTGAPKPAAVQEIENLERTPRGWYSGAVGFLCFNGNLNTGITLRTAHLKDGRASVRAGATLLYGSDPDAEERESRTKAQALLSALLSGHSKEPSTAHVEIIDEIPKFPRKKVLLVDCRDSFVHNLAAYLRELGTEVTTLRPGFDKSYLEELKPDLVILSPGPFTPSHFGIPDLVKELAKRKLPMFGVCLGHQGIGEAFGARLGILPIPFHGKTTSVTHQGTSLFRGLENPVEVGRYHSLFIDESTLPDCLQVLARTTTVEIPGATSGVIMAVEHKTLPIAGVQFHPESLMTLKNRAGHRLLSNVLGKLITKAK